MEQVVKPARKLIGTVTVPGELEPSVLNVAFAACADGKSVVRNTSPAVEPLLRVLGALGVDVEADQGELTVHGKGLRGLSPADGTLQLQGQGAEVMPLVAALACQSFESRVELGEECTGHAAWQPAREAIAAMGGRIERESATVYRIDGNRTLAATSHQAELPLLAKLAIAVAARSADGTTRWRETARSRDGAVRYLRDWFDVVRRRQEEGEDYEVLVDGGEMRPVEVEVAGDLRLSYPFIVAAVALKGSQLILRNVALHAGRRTLLDTMRQIGAPIAIADGDRGTSEITVTSGGLKSTRIAGKRTAAVIEHVALVAVLATQAQGQFVIRDVRELRQGSFDIVAHLVAFLREMGAKVGEFDEGLVIDGGLPLRGTRVETHGDANLALAAATAGLLADGEVTVVDSDCIDLVYPGFFAAVEACKESRK